MSSSLVLWPHALFLADFEAVIQEAVRQERINPSNKGEVAIALKLKLFFEHQVFPRIRSDDWVFTAAEDFADNYSLDCFRQLKLGGRETYEAQKQLHQIKSRVIDFFVRAGLAGGAPQAGKVDLNKASDFYSYVDQGLLSAGMRAEARQLHAAATEQEDLGLWVTLRGIRDLYETSLPRVMYVLRRVIKADAGAARSKSDTELMGVSQTLDWYEANVGSEHLLYPVLGDVRSVYSVVRNVGSHHKGLTWDPTENQVTLDDGDVRLRMPVHEFQQRYRLLMYFCECGLRGILYSFCERERGPRSNNLIREYAKTFPADFPEGVIGRVRFYVSD